MSIYARIAEEKLRAMIGRTIRGYRFVRGQEELPEEIYTDMIGYDNTGNAWIYDVHKDDWINVGAVYFDIDPGIDVESFKHVIPARNHTPFEGAVLEFSNTVVADTIEIEDGIVYIRKS